MAVASSIDASSAARAWRQRPAAELEISERSEDPWKSTRRICVVSALDRPLGDLAPTVELLVPRVRLHEECDRVLRRGRLQYRTAVTM